MELKPCDKCGEVWESDRLTDALDAGLWCPECMAKIDAFYFDHDTKAMTPEPDVFGLHKFCELGIHLWVANDRKGKKKTIVEPCYCTNP